MIILSVGMPRAGSGWYYNLTNDLMLAAGSQDARQIRRRYHLQSVLTEVNCNIGALTPRRLLAVLVPSLLGNTFVIKAHAGPTPMARFLMRRGLLRTSYIYRDPRDAMLSAYENGQRALQNGRANAFSHLVDFDTSLAFMLDYVRIWDAWMQVPEALHARYEDLLTDYEAEAGRLADFLRLDRTRPAIAAVIEKYRPASAAVASTGGDQKGLHFSKGKTGRFRQKMTPEQQAVLADRFGPYLSRMGYEI
jgi:hypothetical protein